MGMLAWRGNPLVDMSAGFHGVVGVVYTTWSSSPWGMSHSHWSGPRTRWSEVSFIVLAYCGVRVDKTEIRWFEKKCRPAVTSREKPLAEWSRIQKSSSWIFRDQNNPASFTSVIPVVFSASVCNSSQMKSKKKKKKNWVEFCSGEWMLKAEKYSCRLIFRHSESFGKIGNLEQPCFNYTKRLSERKKNLKFNKCLKFLCTGN